VTARGAAGVDPAAAPRPLAPIVVELHGVKPATKGNRKQILRVGGRLIVASNDRDRAAEQTLVSLLAYHPARPAAPLDGPLRVEVEARVQVPASWSRKARAAALAGVLRPTSRPDRGNYLKLAEDALEAAGYLRDDALVVEGDVRKVYAEVAGWRIVLTSLTPA